MKLRQLVDERYTASSLLGLSNKFLISKDDKQLVPSTSICHNYFEEVLKENSWLRDSSGQLILNDTSANTAKRVRRSGKYSPQERDNIRLVQHMLIAHNDPFTYIYGRRERNRMHAKKTRDRKKHFFELSDKIITEMENEVKQLREYLASMNVPIPEDIMFPYETLGCKQETCGTSDYSDATESEIDEDVSGDEEDRDGEEIYDDGDVDMTQSQ
jgi:hypothetical protein